MSSAEVWSLWLGGFCWLTLNVIFFSWWVNRKRPEDFSEKFCRERALSYRELAEELDKKAKQYRETASGDPNVAARFAILGTAADLTRQANHMRDHAKIWEERTADE